MKQVLLLSALANIVESFAVDSGLGCWPSILALPAFGSIGADGCVTSATSLTCGRACLRRNNCLVLRRWLRLKGSAS